MPISAKLGVGAVVSCLIHYLKPRERAQAQFGQEYALGRVEDLLVESFLPVVAGKPAVCTVRYRGAGANADPVLNVFAVSCGSLKVTTPAADDARIQVAASMRQLTPARFFLLCWQVRPRAAPAPRVHAAAAVRAVGRDEEERLHDEDDDSEFDDLEDAFVNENADAEADFAVGATFAADFGHDGIDPRKTGAREHVEPHFPATLRNFCHDLGTATASQWLFHWFPFTFWADTCLLATQNQNPALNLTLPVFMNYFTARLIISMHVGIPLDRFWGLEPVTAVNAVPYLGDIISAHLFKEISTAFRMHIDEPGDLPDRFSEVRGMWDAVNQHWEQFGILPGWLCCADESMASFISKFCPGFTNIKRKPRPRGNCLHSIADAITKILFKLVLQEGKDRPAHSPPQKFQHLFPDGGVVGALMMQLAEPLFHSGSIVIHDAGFACIPGLIQLKKRGVFSSCLIKKKAHWPKFTNGAANTTHMANKTIGSADAIQGEFGTEQYHVYMMQDSKFTLQLAATYGTLERKGPDKRRRHPETLQLHTFKYPDAIADYYQGRHAVDDHNHYRQGIASIEDGWATKKYHHRMFAVMLGMCETNAKLAHDHFKGVTEDRKVTSVEWRMQIASDLLRLYPPPILSAGNKKRRHSAEAVVIQRGHELLNVPQYAGQYKGRGPNTIGGFGKCAKQYQQQRCQGARCSAMTRTYCACDPRTPLCQACFALHLAQALR
jgi:hypothetical protein